MSETAIDVASIDSKNDFIAQVRETGVIVPAGRDVDELSEVVVHTEGEGRATRYFFGETKVSKTEVEEMYSDSLDEVHVPTESAVRRVAGEGEIRCRYCGDVVGYLTGSHMKTHEGGPQTVDQYRRMIANEDDIEPPEVPIAPDDLSERFHEWGEQSADAFDYSQEVSDLWEGGHYDHLRKEDDDAETDGGEADAAA